MTISFVGSAQLGDSGSRTSYNVPRPPCSIGDLILMQIGLPERVRGDSALVKSDGDIAAFTDVFTDGFSQPGTAKQYVLDDGSTAKLFWWAGWKLADAADVAGGTYIVNVESGGLVLGADRCKADLVVYSGATGVDTFASQYAATLGGTDGTITCPSVTPTGGSPTGDYEVDSGAGTASYQGGVTIVLEPLPPMGFATVLCAAMSWYENGDLIPLPPLVTREESRMESFVTDAGCWAEAGAPKVLTVWIHDPAQVGHDSR